MRYIQTDTDFYKIAMQQLMFHRFAHVEGEYEFVCRTKNIELAPLAGMIQDSLMQWSDTRFSPDEIQYLRSCSVFKEDYLSFLESFQFPKQYIEVKPLDSMSLSIRTCGPMPYAMLPEIPVLSIVNETYFKSFSNASVLTEGRRRLKEKINFLQSLGSSIDGFSFVEFGTRRRFSQSWQEEVVSTLKDSVPQFFKGTSNIDLARRYNLPVIGTMAHEYLQMYQAVAPVFEEFQQQAFYDWLYEYQGHLGIALTDVIGKDAFFKSFNSELSQQFKGLRHDSGDPFLWAQQAIDHYDCLGINSLEKTLVFSDGLDLQTSVDIFKKFNSKIQTLYGIGTNLTNDLGIPAINIVMKLVRCNGQSVAKIPDSSGKNICKDEACLRRLIETFHLTQSI